jgi:hypothetical protein
MQLDFSNKKGPPEAFFTADAALAPGTQYIHFSYFPRFLAFSSSS